MRRQNRGSMGQMISTMCFAGVGFWLLGEAALTTDDPMRVFVLVSCGLLSLSGALRFQIAWLAHWFRPAEV